MNYVVPVIVCSLCMLFGMWIGSKNNVFNAKKNIQKARDEKYAELKKIFDITNNKAKVTTEELTKFVKYINEDLPTEITTLVISEPKLTVLKEKGGIPDKAYLEAIEPIVINIQNAISVRVSTALDVISAQVIKDLREVIDEPVQKEETK